MAIITFEDLQGVEQSVDLDGKFNVAFNCDCETVMQAMPDKCVDLIVADPPYGIGITGKNRKRGGATIYGSANRIAKQTLYPPFDDNSPPRAEVFSELQRVGKKLIIWGGNFFLDQLGRATCMIVWDKKRRGMSQADCEIAWTNLLDQSRVFEFTWNGFLQENMKEKETRIHATQKPVDLYRFCFNKAKTSIGDIVFDPYLGSGSSRIAAYDAGLNFIGCEIDPVYFAKEEERFARHTKQISLWE